MALLTLSGMGFAKSQGLVVEGSWLAVLYLSKYLSILHEMLYFYWIGLDKKLTNVTFVII